MLFVDPMRSTRLESIAVVSLAGTLGLAGAASANRQSPVVRAVVPSTATVGATVALEGRGFLPGRGRDVVVLRRAAGRAIFLRAGAATFTRIDAPIPACRVLPFLDWQNGVPRPTRFTVSVLAHRLSAQLAPRALTIVPGPPANAAGVRPGTSQCLFGGEPAPDLSGAVQTLR